MANPAILDFQIFSDDGGAYAGNVDLDEFGADGAPVGE